LTRPITQLGIAEASRKSEKGLETARDLPTSSAGRHLYNADKAEPAWNSKRSPRARPISILSNF